MSRHQKLILSLFLFLSLTPLAAAAQPTTVSLAPRQILKTPPVTDVMLCPNFSAPGTWIPCNQYLVGTGGSTGGITTLYFTTNGYRWPANKPNVFLTTTVSLINLVGNPTLAMQMMIASVNQWNNTGSNFKIHLSTQFSGANQVADDQENLLIYNAGQCPHGGACAAAIYYHIDSNNSFHGFDIIIYGIRGDGLAANWTAGPPTLFQTSLPTVITHEIGHALGLGHSTSAKAVMSPGGYGWMANVNYDDQAGVMSLYGNYTNNGFYASGTTISTGGSVTLTLDYGTENANRSYLILGSWGLALPYYAPITFSATDSRKLFVTEALLVDSILMKTYMPQFSGTLDALGRATVQMQYPASLFNPSGLNLYLSGVTLDPTFLSGTVETFRGLMVHFQ